MVLVSTTGNEMGVWLYSSNASLIEIFFFKDGHKFGLGGLKNGSTGRSIKFSIKTKETEGALTSHTTFPIESSTSEEDENMEDSERERRRHERQLRREKRKEKEQKERKEREAFFKKEKLRRDKLKMEDDSSGNEDLYDIFKYGMFYYSP